MPDYSLIGKRVRVLLYDRAGRALGTIEGRVADVTAQVPVGRDPATGKEIKKDLAYLIDIEPLKDAENNEVPYKNSAGSESEGWFAVQDLTVIEETGGAVFRN
jgi:hypothetical protein